MSLYTLYARLSQRFPKFRKFTRHKLYQFLARLYKKRDWTFMNYGFMPLPGETDIMPDLESADEVNRTCIQLYHHVAGSVDLTGQHVLEVGSGRGGGADYIKRYLGPQRMVGVDLSERAVNLCQQYYSTEGLAYMEGDAEALPFDDASFDALVNVESSHCYISMETFLAQVKRIIKPGGYFLFADFRPKEQLDTLRDQLHGSGLVLVKERNITPNVLYALDMDHERRNAHILRGAPGFLKTFVREFAGTKGTNIYERFARGDMVYQSYVLQKPL